MKLNCTVAKGLGLTGVRHEHIAGSTAQLNFTNVNFGTLPFQGSDPITLLLAFLTSTGSRYANGPYDVLADGFGIGIPQDQIDIQGFTNLETNGGPNFDWDTNQQVFFQLNEPESAKDFIDQELCRPFGIYLRTGNDGLIHCVRPRHPQKFYIGGANGLLSVNLSNVAGTLPNGNRFIHLPVGVYAASDLASVVQSELNSFYSEFLHSGSWACSWDGTQHKFTLSVSGTYAGSNLQFTILAQSDNGWATLGWTSLPVGPVTSATAPNARALPPSTLLTQDDLWGVQIVDNMDERITSVAYNYDYSPSKKTFLTSRRYTDPSGEATALCDSLTPSDYVIFSRGLTSAGPNNSSAWTSATAAASGCDCVFGTVNGPVGVNSDTWSQLFAYTLIDRYRNPPLKFRARLKWKWNTLELGDVVRVTYSIPGVFVDSERNATTLTNRLFEIVELHSNFDGSIDATFLGHRYVGY